MNDYRCLNGHIFAAPNAEHGGPWVNLVCPKCGATGLRHITPPHQEQRCPTDGCVLAVGHITACRIEPCTCGDPTSEGHHRRGGYPCYLAEEPPNPPPSDPHEGGETWTLYRCVECGWMPAIPATEPKPWPAGHRCIREPVEVVPASTLQSLQAAHRADLERVAGELNSKARQDSGFSIAEADARSRAYRDAASLIQSLSTKDTET